MVSILRGALAATLGLTLLSAAAPAAAANDVNKGDCRSAGGTFTIDKGTKTCTTTGSGTFGQAYLTVNPHGYEEPYHLASFTWMTPYTITTTQAQKGNEPVQPTTTYTPRLGEGYATNQDCYYLTFDQARDHYNYDSRPVAECQALGLYSPSAQLGR